MKKITGFLLFFLLFPLLLNAQIDVTASGGVPAASYTTLSAAFTAINTGVHTGTISIAVTGNTTETTSALLDSSGNATGSNYTSITMSPSGGNFTISGSIVGHLIDLNGADNVTINGINSGGNSLTIYNNATGTTSAMRLINDATNNVFRNATFRGAGTTVNGSGVIFISTGIVTGNDNNTFSDLNIDGTGTAFSCFYSAGTTASSTQQNSNDTLRDCNLFDYFNTAIASPIGAFLNSGNTDWYISGNSFYQTVARSTTAQGVHTGLQIFPAWTTDRHTVVNNYVGGSAPNATGLMSYTGTATNAVGAIGFSIQTGGPGNIVEGNTAQNISVTYSASAGSFGNAGFFGFIGGYSGTTTFNDNTVNNFNIINNNGAALGSGIHMNGRITANGVTVTPTFNITNNTVNNLNFLAGGAGAAQYYGIRLETSSGASITSGTSNPNFIVSGNIISDLNSSAAGANGWIRGIGTLNTNGTSSTAPLWPKATIDDNIISDINCNSSLASYATFSAVGIQIAGSSNANNNVDTFKITNNIIYDLIVSTVSDVSNSAGGIQGTNSIGFISGNNIFNIANTSPGTTATPIIAGINWRATFATTNIQNNFITLGGGITTNTSIFGILSNFAASSPFDLNYNSVYITGSPAAGTKNCAAYHRGNETFSAAVNSTVNLLNNLFIVDRTGGSGSYFALSSYGTGTWTSNYNALIASSASAIGFWNATAYNFNDFKTNSANDNNSVSLITGGVCDFTVTPSVLNPADIFADPNPTLSGILLLDETNPACWISNGNGIAISSIGTDFKGEPRSTTPGMATDIGGDEFVALANPPAAVESGTFANGGTTTYTLFGKTIMNILWNNIGTISSKTVTLFPGVTPPGALIGTYANGYWDVQVNGGASGYNYDMTLFYDPAFLGTVPNNTDLRMVKRDNVDPWIWIASSVPNNVNNTVMAAGLTTFSQFTVTDQTNPLPVELASFTSSVNRNGVVLNWITSSELNNFGFDIERKPATSEVWNKVGNVQGHGNSNELKNYSFSDNGLQTGKYNYRLKQIDFNGNFEYHNLSGEVIVGVPGKFDLSQNYPNPFNPVTKINYDLPLDGKVSLLIYDITGREVAKLVNQVQPAGYYTIQFNASAFASGVYFYRIAAEGTTTAQQFVMTKKMVLVK